MAVPLPRIQDSLRRKDRSSKRDLRSTFFFTKRSKKRMPEVDDREGVKGVMVALYDFQGRKEDEISFYRVSSGLWSLLFTLLTVAACRATWSI